jgi:Rne/Rng family ribonuclease
MNKELFVSSTPHETKVGLVEDDLLAEIYLERENEYTLAGSIYKGRVTRVLPGMQSAFVDIGLERDAFLYVSDFMELEEQDEDATGTVPTGRAIEDLRPGVRSEGHQREESGGGVSASEQAEPSSAEFSSETASHDSRPGTSAAAVESPNGKEESQDRDRGGWRGRRRRRGGRRDGRDRAPDRGAEHSSESRYSRGESSHASESGRSHPSGPPAGYEPIILPGESISKYQRRSQPMPQEIQETEQARMGAAAEPDSALAMTSAFPEDEPLFAAGSTATEPLHEEHGSDQHENPEINNTQSEASVLTDWRQELRAPAAEVAIEQEHAAGGVWAAESDGAAPSQEESETETEEIVESQSSAEETSSSEAREDQAPAFASPGTMEEETIEDEEVDTIHYESSSDEGYDEFEEETQAAGSEHINGEAREFVSEIHASSLAEGGSTEGAEAHGSEAPGAETEEDSEELELEEAQAEAEAMLEAEARGNGTVDARAEVRAPAGTAGYTQRAPRPAWERRSQRGRRPGGGGRRFRRRESAPVPLISDLLKEGQEILVQIAKEPIGRKGARITSHIALPGRFLVYMPTVNHTGVSRKISSEEERQRLKRIIMSERENGHGGFIVRTAAQNASEEELRADIRFLKGLWNDIRTRAENSKPPALIYHDLNVVERVLRDQVTSDFNVIWVDTEQEYERVLRFFNRFQPALVKRVKLYTKETPLFDQFNLTDEMNKALKSKVWLKSGGYIVINQTEALVAIDINTGKYVGKTQRLEDTIVKTNVDAIKEIVRQIRLRDLGGIIIIDFIDMDERRNRQRVMQALEEELRHDRAPSKTLQFNDFGLVAITRKRVKQSLERTIGAPCPYCQATGYVKSVTTICNEIYVEMRKIAKHLEHEDVMLRVNPDVAKELKSSNAKLLNEMEELTKRTIIVKSDPALHQEQFDIN